MTEAEKREKLEEGAKRQRKLARREGLKGHGALLIAMAYREGWEDRAHLDLWESKDE
jgi:hypothetical protein